jgi:hypothetical protein
VVVQLVDAVEPGRWAWRARPGESIWEDAVDVVSGVVYSVAPMRRRPGSVRERWGATAVRRGGAGRPDTLLAAEIPFASRGEAVAWCEADAARRVGGGR